MFVHMRLSYVRGVLCLHHFASIFHESAMLPTILGLGLMAFQTCCRWISNKCDILEHKWGLRMRWRQLTCHLLGMHSVTFFFFCGCLWLWWWWWWRTWAVSVSCFFFVCPHLIRSLLFRTLHFVCPQPILTHSFIPFHSMSYHAIPSSYLCDINYMPIEEMLLQSIRMPSPSLSLQIIPNIFTTQHTFIYTLIL